MNKEDKQTNKNSETDNSMVVTRGKGGVEDGGSKGGKVYVMEGVLTLGGKHIMQYTDGIL